MLCRLQTAANTINQTVMHGGSRVRLVQYNRLAFAVHEVNAFMLTKAAEILGSGAGGMQNTHDLVSLWTAELESAAAMPLDLVEEKRLKSLLLSMKNILEGHAKALCTQFRMRGRGLTRDAILYYGAMHLPLWDKALAIVCDGLQASRKTPVGEVYRVMRVAAGLEKSAHQVAASECDDSDPDYFDLNASDEEGW